MAHDLGHPPFGHNGEAALDVCMKDAGGFEGNAQTFRILGKTEKKDYRGDVPTPIDDKGNDQRLGLNLAYRTLASIIKYDRKIPNLRKGKTKLVKGIYKSEARLFDNVKTNVSPNFSSGGNFKTIECSIMDISDDIAYSTYDLEDTFKAGFLNPLEIIASSQNSDLMERVSEKASKNIGRKLKDREVLESFLEIFSDFVSISDDSPDKDRILDEIVYRSIEYYFASSRLASDGYLRTKFTADLVSEFISSVQVAINEDDPKMSRVFLLEDQMKKVEILKHYTFESTIRSPMLRVSEERGYDIVRKLFEKLDSEAGHLLLPQDYRELYQQFADDTEKKRVVCDFIAGMTDRYAIEFYGRIFSENPQSIFKPF